MALAVIELRAQDGAGNFLTDVDVEVRSEEPGLPLVQLYSDRDGSSAIGNPVNFPDGIIRFYVAEGAYQIVVSKDGVGVDTFHHRAAGTAAERDIPIVSSDIEFSDLLLPAGGTINWGAGDVVITHSTNRLDFTGASSGYLFGETTGRIALAAAMPTGHSGIVLEYGITRADTAAIYATTEGTALRNLAISPGTTGKVFIGTSQDVEAATYPGRFKFFDEITAGKIGSSGYVAFDVLVLSSATGDNGAFRAAITQNASGDADIRAGEFHTIKSAGSASQSAWALEIGLHSDVAPATTRDGVGLFISSWNTGWTPGSGARQGSAIYIEGEDGWTHGFRYMDTNGSDVLVSIGQGGDFASRSFVHPYFFTAPPAGGTVGVGLRMGSVGATPLGVFFGSGAPTLEAGVGSLYLRTSGGGASTRLYVANSTAGGAGSWSAITSA